MLKKIRTLTLSALVGLGTLAGAPAIANAGDIGIQVHFGGHRHHHNGHRWHRPACSTNQALHKAKRMGVRHARVIRATQRSVTVRGRNHHHPVRITFARAPGCPVIR